VVGECCGYSISSIHIFHSSKRSDGFSWNHLYLGQLFMKPISNSWGLNWAKIPSFKWSILEKFHRVVYNTMGMQNPSKLLLKYCFPMLISLNIICNACGHELGKVNFRIQTLQVLVDKSNKTTFTNWSYGCIWFIIMGIFLKLPRISIEGFLIFNNITRNFVICN
jgi:hypothetical protein